MLPVYSLFLLLRDLLFHELPQCTLHCTGTVNYFPPQLASTEGLDPVSLVWLAHLPIVLALLPMVLALLPMVSPQSVSLPFLEEVITGLAMNSAVVIMEPGAGAGAEEEAGGRRQEVWYPISNKGLVLGGCG